MGKRELPRVLIVLFNRLGPPGYGLLFVRIVELLSCYGSMEAERNRVLFSLFGAVPHAA